MVLSVTVVFNFGAEAVDRLTAKRLIDLGVPAAAEEIAWFTLFGVIGLVAGAVALRWVETQYSGNRGSEAAVRDGGVGGGWLGRRLLALAPNYGTGARSVTSLSEAWHGRRCRSLPRSG